MPRPIMGITAEFTVGCTDALTAVATMLLLTTKAGPLSPLSSSSNFLSDELRLGKLSETVVVHGNAPHDRPPFLMCHLIGNRASFLCTKAAMLRVPDNWPSAYLDICPLAEVS